MRPQVDPACLSNYLDQAHGEKQCVYAVLEPAEWPEVDDVLEESGLSWTYLAKGTLSAEHYRILPRVALLRPKSRIMRPLAEHLCAAGILATTCAPGDLYALIAHFWDIAQSRMPDGKTAWLRFYEPYVLHTCMRTFDEKNKNILYGKHVTAFAVPECRDGSLRLYARQPDTTYAPPPLRISHEYTEAFDAAHLQLFVFELALYLASAYRPGMPEGAFSEFESHVAETVETAQHYGFITNDNIRRFTELALAAAWNFHELPPACRVLERDAGSPEAKLAALEDAMKETPLTHMNFSA